MCPFSMIETLKILNSVDNDSVSDLFSVYLKTINIQT